MITKLLRKVFIWKHEEGSKLKSYEGILWRDDTRKATMLSFIGLNILLQLGVIVHRIIRTGLYNISKTVHN